MSHWKRLLAVLALTSLAACGGGGGSAGTPTLGGGTSGAVTDIVIVPSADTIANTGTSTVTATITVVDVNRAGVTDASVSVAVDNNAVVSTSGARTDASGQITATIGIGSDRSNRDITITARAGGITRTAVVKVVTDPNANTPTAADLSLVLGAPSVTNGGSSTVTATVTAVDANRNVIRGIPVTLSVDAGATLAASATVTDALGLVTANVGIGADRSNRVVTVTAVSGSLVRTASFAVTGARLTASASPLVVAGSAGNVVEYTLLDFNAVAMADQPITVTAPGLPTANGRTDLNGKFRFVYTAPASQTVLSITATAAGDQNAQTVTVSPASSSIAAAPEMPQSASVTPSPSVVSVNAPGTATNQVELRALFVGANNRPVPRVRVRFDLAGNLSSTDGRIDWVGSYAYSDDNGIARATFTSGQRPSPTNGVTVRMCYDTVDFASGANACDGVAGFATATLTVSSEAMAVTIGTNNEIKQGRNNLTYIKEYVVLVVDAAGRAKPDTLITPSVDLTGFYKGFYSTGLQSWGRTLTLEPTERYGWTGTAWAPDGTPGLPVCPNEDINRNAVREATALIVGAAAPALAARGEDLNWNGDLDPRKSDVAVSMVGSSKTDQNGLAVVQIEYPESVATWIDFVLTVTASGVSGTEARARFSGTLDASAADINNLEAEPAFRISPWGSSTTCTDTQ